MILRVEFLKYGSLDYSGVLYVLCNGVSVLCVSLALLSWRRSAKQAGATGRALVQAAQARAGTCAPL